MRFDAKRELLIQTAGRYRQTSHKQRSVILGEGVAAARYDRDEPGELNHRWSERDVPA